MVSCTPSLDSEMPICLMIYLSMHFISGQQDVDRFLVFMVSYTPSLDSEMPIGFMILWFYGFVHSISGHRDDDRFHGFVVSWFISPCNPSLDRFLGFMVSWFCALHLWTARCR